MAFDADISKVKVGPGAIVSAETTVTADLYSTVCLRKKNMNMASFHVIIDAGNLAGNYYIQESNDGTNWANVEFDDGSTAQAISGTDINDIHHVVTAAKFIGFFLDYTSGTGTQVDVNVSWSHSAAY